jgi:hypothetical protein
MDVPFIRDPRWLKLHDREWVCPCCGETHSGPFDIACDKPDFWPGPGEKSPNSDVMMPGDPHTNVLTEDFCILNGEHFFVRCVLRLPIVGTAGEHFGFGVWATLSKKNFETYLSVFDAGDAGDLGPWFGWFSNRLPGYPDTLNVKCRVHPQDHRQRPHIELEPTDHPLAIDQRQGITLDRLLEIYALSGHDIRPGLLSA